MAITKEQVINKIKNSGFSKKEALNKANAFGIDEAKFNAIKSKFKK